MSPDPMPPNTSRHRRPRSPARVAVRAARIRGAGLVNACRHGASDVVASPLIQVVAAPDHLLPWPCWLNVSRRSLRLGSARQRWLRERGVVTSQRRASSADVEPSRRQVPCLPTLALSRPRSPARVALLAERVGGGPRGSGPGARADVVNEVAWRSQLPAQLAALPERVRVAVLPVPSPARLGWPRPPRGCPPGCASSRHRRVRDRPVTPCSSLLRNSPETAVRACRKLRALAWSSTVYPNI
jgi:hypothetical protein